MDREVQHLFALRCGTDSDTLEWASQALLQALENEKKKGVKKPALGSAGHCKDQLFFWGLPLTLNPKP